MAAQAARMLGSQSSGVSIVLAGEFKTPRDNIVKKLETMGLSSPSKLTKKSVLCLADVQRPHSSWQHEAILKGVPVVSETFVQRIMDAKKPAQLNLDDLIASCAVSMDTDELGNPTSTVMNSDRRKRKAATIAASPLSNHFSPQKRRKMSTAAIAEKIAADQHDTLQGKKKSHVIALEGLIGIGKSTLCNKLLDIYPNDCDVYKEQTNEKFLQLFYSDTKKYGFALQWGMLKSRIYQLRLAQHDAANGRIPPRKYFYWDRSMIGDYTFALWNHLLGGISKQEMDVYESEFGGSVRALQNVPFMHDIDLFVFMDDEPTRCKHRVEALRKNPSEQGIPIEYYQGLDDIHFHIFIDMMIKRVSNVVVVSWGHYHDAVACQTLFENVIHGRKRTPTVARVEMSHVADPSPNSYVYESAQQILEFYEALHNKSSDLLTQGQQYENVYIPSNALTIPSSEKGIILDHDYDITFYRNEYKRVVMWHLSNFQNIYFYNNRNN